MKRTRTAMHMIYLLIIAVLLTLLYVERRDSLNLIIPDDENVTHPEYDGLSEQLTEQYQLLTQIEERLSTLELSSRQNDIHNYTQVSVDNSAEAETLPSAQDIALADNPLATRRNFNPDLIGQSQRQTFEAEETDPEWAYLAEDAIRDAFATDDYLRELQYQSIECRSTLCRIMISNDMVGGLNTPAIMYSLNNIETLDTRVSVAVNQEDIMELYLQR